VNESAEAPGKGPEKDPIDAAVDKKIDEIMKDAGKRARAFAEKGVPTFSDVYQDDTPYDQFLADLKSGTEEATKYVKYIKQVAEYAEKTGDVKALAPIAGAAKNLNKISSTIASGLGSFGKKLDTARKIAKWCEALGDFAEQSEAMSAGDRESVTAWVKSMERLWNATVPFVEWLKSEAFEAALGGSEAAGAASATLAIVGAELFIGIKALEAGVHNVNAYFDKMDERMREIDGKPPKQGPKPPEAPGNWSTRKEIADGFRADEKTQLRRKLTQEENAQRAKEADDEAASLDDFDAGDFPTTYWKNARKGVWQLVVRDYLRAKGDAARKGPEAWMECFQSDEPPVEIPDDSSEPTESVPAAHADEIPKLLQEPDSDGLAAEVRQLLDCVVPCPYFQKVHEHSWSLFKARAKNEPKRR
jgi:DNA-binding ferritin-like protein